MIPVLSCSRPPGIPAGHRSGRSPPCPEYPAPWSPPSPPSPSPPPASRSQPAPRTRRAAARTTSPPRPHLPARRLQPGRHPVHHRLHHLRLRVDRDRPAVQLLHHRAEEEADRRVRLHGHQHLGLRGGPLRPPRTRRCPQERAQPLARAGVRHQDRRQQGHRREQAQEGRLRRHRHPLRRPGRDRHGLDDRAVGPRPELIPSARRRGRSPPPGVAGPSRLPLRRQTKCLRAGGVLEHREDECGA